MPHMSDVAARVRARVDALPAARSAVAALRPHGRVYAVGGAVRDAVLGREAAEIDLLAAVPAERLEAALRSVRRGRLDLTGRSFAVYRFRHGGDEVEIALPRTERSTGAGHRDFAVTADASLPVEDDLRRRDFTVNAIAVDLETGEVIDPLGGLADARARVLRVVGPRSFLDDPLRTVRALVARARHGLEPDAATREQMRLHAGRVRHLPGERLGAELDRLLAGPEPDAGLRLGHEVGVLAHLLPEVERGFGYDQRRPKHRFDLATHLLLAARVVADEGGDRDLRLAALLHDIGKPDTVRDQPDGTARYPGHARAGALLAEEAMTRLRYPVHRIRHVSLLVRLHPFRNFDTPAGARQLLFAAGSHEAALDLIALRRADRAARGTPDPGADTHGMARLVERAVAAGEAVYSARDLAVGGRELMDDLGMRPGPELGRVLAELVQAVIEDPALNRAERLRRRARESLT